MAKACDWFKTNKLTLNISKTKYMLFREKKMKVNFDQLNLKIDDVPIERIGDDCDTKFFKFVGLHLDEHLSWAYQLNHIQAKLASGNYAINQIKNTLPPSIRKLIYNSLFRSHLESN